MIPCVYNFAEKFSEGLARVRVDELEGFIDKKGKLVIPCVYDRVENFSDGMARIMQNDMNGFINTKGEMVISCNYDMVGNFSEGLCRVLQDGKFGFINKKGEVVIPCTYKTSYEQAFWGGDFSEGLAVVTNGDGLYGFIDKKGVLVIPCIYDMAWGFQKDWQLLQRIINEVLSTKTEKWLFLASTILLVAFQKD